MTPTLQGLLERATLALGRLDGLAALLPDVELFIYMYVRKEALLSSQIEGTQSSLTDLLLFESEDAPGMPLDDVREVSRYVAAMSHGLERLHSDFPLSLRLIREIHEVLMRDARGGDKSPGEFRRSQNWLGGTRPGNAVFVPPPQEHVMDLMSDLERFMHDPNIPTLIKAALAHVQFETIHPFLDGNGRTGRLLITFLLCAENVLSQPTLYLSLYFKTHRSSYYDLLQRVRTEGVWEDWLEFFLQGVLETATNAVNATRSILARFHEDRGRIEALGRSASSVLRVHQHLERHPFVNVGTTAMALGLSIPTITKAFEELEQLGVLREITGRPRSRKWVYQKYLDLLAQGTEPIPPA
jgi:Fic family protein